MSTLRAFPAFASSPNENRQATSTSTVAALPEPYAYTSFGGGVLQLYPYVGDHVALLVPAQYYDLTVLDKIVRAADQAYEYYAQANGREPDPYYQYQGRATIAAVPSTCGAGCGFLGATGIELQTDYFDMLFRGVADSDQFDQVVFYELGRNFWFYEEKISYLANDPITTGYAVFMRFMSMDAAGVVGAPFGDLDFETFRARVQGILPLYLADPSLNWANTMQIGYSPDFGTTDMFASFLFELRARFGDAFLMKIWKEVAKLPNRGTTQDAVNNFVLAASRAAGQDLTALFRDTWRWPVTIQLQVFADGFEAGNLNVWSAKVTDGSDLRASASAALVGRFGLQALINDNNLLYVTDDRPNGEGSYGVRFRFDPNSLPMANNDLHTIFYGYTGASTQVLRLDLRHATGRYQVRAALRNDATTWKNSTWFSISDAPHLLQLDWGAATADGANNGALAFRIDNVLKSTLSGVDNDTRRIDRVRLGAVAGIDVGTRGSTFFDDFASSRLAAIPAAMTDVANGASLAAEEVAEDTTEVFEEVSAEELAAEQAESASKMLFLPLVTR